MNRKMRRNRLYQQASKVELAITRDAAEKHLILCLYVLVTMGFGKERLQRFIEQYVKTADTLADNSTWFDEAVAIVNNKLEEEFFRPL